MSPQSAWAEPRQLQPPPLLIAIVLLALCSGGYGTEVGGFTVTFERALALPLLACALLVAIASGSTFGFPPSGWLVASWLLLSLVSSLYGPSSSFAFRMWVLLSTAAAFFFALRLGRISPLAVVQSSPFSLLALLLGPVCACVYLLSLVAVDVPFVTEKWLHESGGGVRLRGPLLEPNLYACFSSATALIVLATSYERRWVKVALLLGLHLGIAFSFSRVPWAAHAAAGLFYMYLIRGNVLPASIPLRALAVGSVLLCVVLLVIVIATNYSEAELLHRTGSISTRLIMWELALDDVYSRPVLGSGVFSLSELHPTAMYAVGSDSSHSVWVSNMFLLALHDGGLLGLVLLASAVAVVLFRGVTTVRRELAICGQVSPDGRALAALVAAVLSLVIAGQSIPNYSSGFFWVLLALTELLTAHRCRELRHAS